MMFHGKLFIGSSQEEFDVVYDTGSDWVVVEGNQCRNCEGNTYNPLKSTSSKNLGKGTSVRAYGSAVLYGTEYTDKICLSKF
jgi:hypothetical protein